MFMCFVSATLHKGAGGGRGFPALSSGQSGAGMKGEWAAGAAELTRVLGKEHLLEAESRGW